MWNKTPLVIETEVEQMRKGYVFGLISVILCASYFVVSVILIPVSNAPGSKDLSSYILSFREELEAKEGSNKTNPYITIDKNEYPSLATCLGEWWINFL